MSEGSNDPLDEAAAQLAHLARALLTASEAGLRIHTARAARSRGALPPALPNARRPREDGTDTVRVSTAPALLPSPSGQARSRQSELSGTTTPPARGRSSPGARSPARVPSRGPSAPLLLAVHGDALDYFRAQERPSWTTTLLQERGLTACWDAPWSAGYAPAAWTQLTDHLRSRGWDDEILLTSGLSRRSRTGNLIDHFRDRIVLPLLTADGQVVGFVGRCAPGADPRTPKYLNSPASAVYDKSTLLFGLHEGRAALGNAAVPVLVEGPLDAIAVAVAGGDDFVGLAACGTSLTDGHVSAIGEVVDLPRTTVVVATDHDAAGDAAAVKAFERIAGRCADQRRAGLPEGLDPAEVLRRDGSLGLRTALTTGSRPLLDVAVDHRLRRWSDQLQWVQGRVKAARHVAPLIAQLAEPERARAVRGLAERLDLMESTVSDAVAQACPSRAPDPQPTTPSARPERAGPVPVAPRSPEPPPVASARRR